MKKIIGILLLCSALNMQAQYVRPGDGNTTQSNINNPNSKPGGFGENLSIGGSFGLQFGTYTYVGLEPLLNYHFNKSFMVGAGPIYQYVSEDFGYGYGRYSSSTYGARITALFFLPEDLDRVFLMGEYDVLNVPEQSFITGQMYRGNLALPMLGLGYKEKVTDKLFFFVYGLWNFNNSVYNPYSNPVIDAGFDLGLWH